MSFLPRSVKPFIEQIRKNVTKRSSRSLKVLVIGLAKSGTSILMYRISGGLSDPAEFFEPRSMAGQNDVNFHKEVASYRKDVITKIIFHPDKPSCLENILPLYDKVVWIIRDPRDQLISSFFYRWYSVHNPNKEAFGRALAMTRQKEQDPSSVPFHTLAKSLSNVRGFTKMYSPFLQELQRWKDEIFVLRYENLMRGNLDDLEVWLGRTIDRTAKVKAPAHQVARSMAAENWRSWFTPEDVEFYKPILSPYLEKLGYSADDWKLHNHDFLSSEEGSEYMVKIFSNHGN